MAKIFIIKNPLSGVKSFDFFIVVFFLQLLDSGRMAY